MTLEGKLVISGSGVTGGCVTWDGNAWGSLGQSSVQARCLQPFGASLFASIVSSSSPVGRGLTELRSGRWKPIGIGFDSDLSSLDVYQDQLVLSGGFQQVPGSDAATIARWNGATWSRVGAPTFTYVGDILTIGPRLYGRFGSTTFASWDGVKWTTLPALRLLPTSYSVSRYGSEFVVTGEFFDSTVPNVTRPIAMWNGTAWRTPGTDLSGAASSAVEHEGDLIVAGDSRSLRLASDPTARPPFRFDGTTWRAWPVGIDGGAFLTSQNGRLFIVGSSVSGLRGVDGTKYGVIAQWHNNQWKSMDSGLFPFLTQIIALTPYKNDLIVAGNIQSIDGVAVNNIARWNGTQWKAMGSGLVGGYVYDVQQFGDELIAIGWFTTAGGSLSPYFARWTDDPKPWLAVQPQSRPMNQGLTLSLRAAAASGYVNVSYQWKRNGEAVQNGPGGASISGGIVTGAAGALPSPSDGSDVVLRIEGVQASDAGEYTVEFSNACNTTSSWAAAVTVNTCPGDLNADGLVDDTDFNLFAAAYDTLLCDDSAMPAGCLSDWNGDGLVDDRDFQVFVGAYTGMVCD
jgi:trimeric autotransporter adhesin